MDDVYDVCLRLFEAIKLAQIVEEEEETVLGVEEEDVDAMGEEEADEEGNGGGEGEGAVAEEPAGVEAAQQGTHRSVLRRARPPCAAAGAALPRRPSAAR